MEDTLIWPVSALRTLLEIIGYSISIVTTLLVGLLFCCCFGSMAFKMALWVWRGDEESSNDVDAVPTLIVAGSGGHTSEVLRLASGLSDHYYPRTYIVAVTDETSERKIRDFEEERKKRSGKLEESGSKGRYSIVKIRRSREVRQSWISTVFSTLGSLVSSFKPVVTSRPSFVLVNGPGTCVPVCLVVASLNFVGFLSAKLVFVESLCRVKTMSLSGRIVYHAKLADAVIVQWPELLERYPKATYLPRVV